jgi:hypothetical protein
MRYVHFLLFIFLAFGVQKATAQKEPKKITPISRAVDGELITMDNDTIFGTIKIKNAEDYYITSIIVKDDNYGKRTLTAYDIRWFRQVVPYPDREAFGVDHVFFKSGPHPQNKNKKVFLPAEK